MTSGTLGCMRKALEFETTAQPAAANFGSSSRAMSASSAAKIIFGAPAGLGRRDRHLRDALGAGSVEAPFGGVLVRLPLERSLAASQVIWNQGWFSSS
jgi:hypothetical protein